MVVFPLAVPPATSAVDLCSTNHHKYAAMSADIVLYFIRSMMDTGSSLNLLIVNVLPFFVISLPSVKLILSPPGNDASTIGCAMDMC